MLEEITSSTMAVIPVVGEKYQSKILNVDGEVYSEKTQFALIKEACLEGGSTYEGRRQAMTHFSGKVQRSPIPVNPEQRMFAFPTHATTNWEHRWIFYFHVKGIAANSKSAFIFFKNGHKEEVPISFLSLDRQMQRTAQCIVRFSRFKPMNSDWFLTT